MDNRIEKRKRGDVSSNKQGPPEGSVDLPCRLEEMGVAISAQSKEYSARYTRLFSKAVTIGDWDNEEELYREMVKLFENSQNQAVLAKINSLLKKRKTER